MNGLVVRCASHRPLSALSLGHVPGVAMVP